LIIDPLLECAIAAEQLVLMLRAPFAHDSDAARRKRPFEQLSGRDRHERLVPLVLDVDVRGFVVVEVHPDRDPEEEGDDRYRGSTEAA
jgi:hypothetical protein